MQFPPIPHDEPQRLRALHELHLLDSNAEERFDRLTRLARQTFGVPIALVSLVDDRRQWFKSRQGLDACETGRDVSFCAHAILGNDLFEVCDASQDPRFADNPLVTGGPKIRFYAGAPLITADGHGIGTLCIIDTRPHRLSSDERRALRDLADLVMLEVEQADQREQTRKLRSARQLAEAIVSAQSQFIRLDDQRRAYDGLLTDILELTDSEYGFIGEVLYDSDGDPYLKTHAITNIAWDDETAASYVANASEGLEFHNLDTLIGAILTGDGPVIANDADRDPRRGGLPDGHPPLTAFLGIPIHHGTERVAMLGIANRPGGYDESLVEFLTPLLVTVGQLVVAARTQERHREDQVLLKRLSRVASETTNGVVMTDVEGRVEWINEGFTRLSGYTLDELGGFKPGDLLQGAETDPATVAQMRSALRDGEGFEVDVVNYHRVGTTYWVRIQCTPLHDDYGRLQGFMSIESDITEARQAARALQASETRLRGLFELSPIGIALNDYETGEFVDLNQALLAPTGYSREEFVSLSYWDLTPKEYEPEEAQQLESMEKTGRYGPFEKEYIRKDGSRYPVLLNGMWVRDSTGRKLIWSIVEDISERKRIERMKSEFISTVSHELRTPLTSISGSLGLVMGGAAGSLPDKACEMLEIAHNNSRRLGLLINDLLDMEKLVAGKMPFALKIQPLRPLLEQAIRDNQSYADHFGVHLELEAIDNEPKVDVDAGRLQQVLANLLSNAAKFSPEGGRIRLYANAGRELVRISVADQGPGIPEEFHDRIFQKFSQADGSDTRQKPGTGLGLAITRELVERMAGNIGFESVPGEGATFFVELPLARESQQA